MGRVKANICAIDISKTKNMNDVINKLFERKELKLSQPKFFQIQCLTSKGLKPTFFAFPCPAWFTLYYTSMLQPMNCFAKLPINRLKLVQTAKNPFKFIQTVLKIQTGLNQLNLASAR